MAKGDISAHGTLSIRGSGAKLTGAVADIAPYIAAHDAARAEERSKELSKQMKKISEKRRQSRLPEDLSEELPKTITEDGISRSAAIKKLAAKYHVTPDRVRQKLRDES